MSCLLNLFVISQDDFFDTLQSGNENRRGAPRRDVDVDTFGTVAQSYPAVARPVQGRGSSNKTQQAGGRGHGSGGGGGGAQLTNRGGQGGGGRGPTITKPQQPPPRPAPAPRKLAS